MDKYIVRNLQDFVEIFFEVLSQDFRDIPEPQDDYYPQSFPCVFIVNADTNSYMFIYKDELNEEPTQQNQNLVESKN
jgi:hypothetical protein